MANSKVLEYVLKLRDEASQTAEKAASNIDGAMRNAAKGSQMIAGGLLAASAAAGFYIKGAVLTAARTEELAIAMEAVAKSTGTSMSVLREQESILKKQGITTQQSRQTLMNFMQAQLDVADASKIARVAQDLAVISGENSSETTNRLTTAIATQNTMLLRQVGITATQTEAFDAYAETIGKTGTELTSAEKKQALLNLILKEGEKVTGTYEAAMTNAYKKMGSLDRKFEEARNTIGGKFLPVFERLIDVVDSLLDQVTEENVDKVFGWMKEYAPIIAGVIGGALVPALYSLALSLKAAAIGAWALITPLLPFIAIGAAIGLAIKLIIDALGGWEEAQRKVGLVIKSAKEILEKAKEKFNEFVEFLGTLPQKVGEFFTRVKEKIVELTIQTLTWYVNFWMTLPEKLAFALGFVLGTVVKWGTDTWNYLKENVPIWIEGVVTFFSELPGKIWEWLVKLYNKIVDWGVKTWNYLSTKVPEWLGNLVGWFKELPGKIWEGLSNLKDKIMERFSSAWQALKDEVSSWPGKIWEWGKNVATSFVDGIKNGLKGLKDAFVSGFNSAKGAVESNSPPKEGPFKNIDQWGFNIGESFISGMRAAVSDLGLSGMPALATAGGQSITNNNQRTTQAPITINAEINNDMDAQQLAGIIGMELELRSRF